MFVAQNIVFDASHFGKPGLPLHTDNSCAELIEILLRPHRRHSARVEVRDNLRRKDRVATPGRLERSGGDERGTSPAEHRRPSVPREYSVKRERFGRRLTRFAPFDGGASDWIEARG